MERRPLFRLVLVLVLMQVGFGAAGMAADQPIILKIGGTGGAYGGMKALAQAFQRQHPQISVVFPSTLGSTGGIKAVLAGAIDLAMSTRPLTAQETQRRAVAYIYARTPFVFATPDRHLAAAARFTLNDIAAIYAGQMTTWPDGTPLRLVVRSEIDYDAVLLKGMSPEMAAAVRQAETRRGMRLAVTDNDNAEMLTDLWGGLGSISLAQIMGDHHPFHPLSVGGVAPSLENLKNGTYPYSKSFSLVIGPHPKAEARQFLEFVFSPQGREILKQTGHLPESRAHE